VGNGRNDKAYENPAYKRSSQEQWLLLLLPPCDLLFVMPNPETHCRMQQIFTFNLNKERTSSELYSLVFAITKRLVSGNHVFDFHSRVSIPFLAGTWLS